MLLNKVIDRIHFNPNNLLTELIHNPALNKIYAEF